MANIDISKLPPELQKAVLAATTQQAQPEPAAPVLQPQPGDKMDPNEAVKIIAQMMGQQQPQNFGRQLTTNEQGQLSVEVPTQGLLPRLLQGKTKKVAVPDPTNFFASAKEAGIERFLPANTPRMPDGTPFVTKENFFAALNTAQSFGDKKRQDYWTPIGYDDKVGGYVSQNAATNEFTITPRERLAGKTRPNLPEGQANEYIQYTTLVNQIDKTLGSIKPEKLGLIDGSFGKTITYYAKTDPETAEMFKRLDMVFTEIAKELYGATLAGNELAQAKAAIYSKYQTPEAIQAALLTQRDKYVNKLQSQLEYLKAGQFAGTDRLPQPAPKPNVKTEAKSKGQELKFDTPEAIKEAYKAGQIGREKAKELIRNLGQRK